MAEEPQYGPDGPDSPGSSESESAFAAVALAAVSEAQSTVPSLFSPMTEPSLSYVAAT
jgi:hypothetical protein